MGCEEHENIFNTPPICSCQGNYALTLQDNNFHIETVGDEAIMLCLNGFALSLDPSIKLCCY